MATFLNNGSRASILPSEEFTMTIPVSAENTEAVPVDVNKDIQQEYNQLLALVMRMSDWLTSPQSQLLPSEQWEEHFQRHQQNLERLRLLGDFLRPTKLRDRTESLQGDKLTQEIAELFAD